MMAFAKSVLLLSAFVAISFHSTASTDGKKNANNANETNSSGIVSKIGRLVTAGLAMSALGTGGANAYHGPAAKNGVVGWTPPQVSNRAMIPPPLPSSVKKTRLEKMAENLRKLAEDLPKHENRVSPSGPDPHHHFMGKDSAELNDNSASINPMRVSPGGPDPHHH